LEKVQELGSLENQSLDQVDKLKKVISTKRGSNSMNRQWMKTDRTANNKEIITTEQIYEKPVMSSPGKKKVLKASVSVASTAPSSMGRT
jgi:hypothetical protein